MTTGTRVEILYGGYNGRWRGAKGTVVGYFASPTIATIILDNGVEGDRYSDGKSVSKLDDTGPDGSKNAVNFNLNGEYVRILAPIIEEEEEMPWESVTSNT